jgi:(4-(4-[2-(gamma-L-glutamylamino)ethyl]phenoxymethyl)furan-2-yl)methanamine synthase
VNPSLRDGSQRGFPRVLGLDVGGANLKVANADGVGLSSYFPMWSDHQRLSQHLVELIRRFCQSTGEDYGSLALTMTGEMADCFATRREGVNAILKHVCHAAPNWQIYVYTVDGEWLAPQAAMEDPWQVAASNWHALASWLVIGPGATLPNLRLIVDIGSTTVDIIPVDSQGVRTVARTDAERLRMQQLVYTGISRTPVSAILSTVQFRGALQPVVAERFATSDDAYVALGLDPGIDDDLLMSDAGTAPTGANPLNAVHPTTADGRPRSPHFAAARLARMVGEDSERLTSAEIQTLAQQVIDAQAQKVAAAIAVNLAYDTMDEDNLDADRHLARGNTSGLCPQLLISGHGRHLANASFKLLQPTIDVRYLDELISNQAARCAPAVAVAWLAEQGASPFQA